MCFLDMIIMLRSNVVDSVNKSAGRLVFRINTIPERHTFHIKEKTVYSVHYILLEQSTCYVYLLKQKQLYVLVRLCPVNCHQTSVLSLIRKTERAGIGPVTLCLQN